MKYVEEHIGLKVDLVKDENGNYIPFEWRDVLGYEGYYRVSNYGQVKGKDRQVRTKGGGLKTWKGKLKSIGNIGRGYRNVQLSVRGVNRSISLHKVIYEAFHGLIPVEMTLDHIDRNPSNNVLWNLRVLTRSHNSMNRGSVKGSASRYKGVHRHSGTWKWRVCSHEPYGAVHLGYFELEGEAAQAYNEFILKERGPDLAVLNDLTDHDWEADRERVSNVRRKGNATRKVCNLDTGVVYESISEASRALSIHNSCIYKVCSNLRKTAGGFRFAFADNHLTQDKEGV